MTKRKKYEELLIGSEESKAKYQQIFIYPCSRAKRLFPKPLKTARLSLAHEEKRIFKEMGTALNALLIGQFSFAI